jgi:hypothetical protein
MRPVRIIDAPAVGWTLSNAFTPTRATACAAAPMWALAALVLPGFVQAGRGAVVLCVTRRSRALVRWALSFARVFACLLVVVVLCQAVAPLGGSVTANLVPVVLLLIAAATLPGVVLTALQPGIRARLRGHRVSSGAQWEVDMLAARPGASGLATATAYLASVIPPDASIGTHAATERHVRVYRRYGFEQVDPADPLLLVRPPASAKRTVAQPASASQSSR